MRGSTPPPKKSPPTGIGRNVEIFDRLRRWAYVAVADWRIGTYDAWYSVVADRGEQIAADVGAESPRGPLKANEVGHIVKSVARWVWERYGADIPPLLREARIAAQRERERARQGAREAARARSRMTRAEYVAPARQRRTEAKEMREKGIAVREIARVLSVSVREVYRLLASAAAAVVRLVGSATAACVQGSPSLSDFGGPLVGTSPPCLAAGSVGRTSVDVVETDDAVTSEPSTAHGGAIAAAIASEYAVPARRAESETDVTSNGRGVRGGTSAGESSIAYIQRRIREIVANLRQPERPP